MTDKIFSQESFIPDEIQPTDETCLKYGWIKGTVEATLHGKTMRVRATKYGPNEITAHGFCIKYRTGTKVWKASVSQRPYHDGTIGESVQGGFDSRSGKHQKINSIWFADDVKNPANFAHA